MVKSSQRPQSPRSVVTRAVVSVSSSPVLTPPAPKPLEPRKALAEYQSAVYESESWSSLVPRPITDLTLSGARPQARTPGPDRAQLHSRGQIIVHRSVCLHLRGRSWEHHALRTVLPGIPLPLCGV